MLSVFDYDLASMICTYQGYQKPVAHRLGLLIIKALFISQY